MSESQNYVVASLSRVQRFATRGLQHARLPCPSPSPRACSNSGPLSQWYRSTISSSVACSPTFSLSEHQGLLKVQSWSLDRLGSPWVVLSYSVVSDSLWPYGLQHTKPLCPALSPRACSNSGPLSWRCHPTLSSSVASFSCLQSFPASESFLMSRLFASGGQSIGASASASVLPMNIQDWFPVGLTGFISLLSKGLSRITLNPP